jgi:hypothetical protein
MHKDKNLAQFQLRKAESVFLKSAGWRKSPSKEGFWIAPEFPGWPSWENIEPGDSIPHCDALEAQKSFDAQH